MKTQLLPSNLH